MAVPSDLSDEALLKAAAGDPSAFEALYHRYRDWVVSLAFRYCRNEFDALDVLQETFTYLHRKLPGFELRAKLKTFLFPVVKHLSFARHRAAHRHAPLEVDVQARDATEENESVRRAVDSLPEAYQEVVWLRFVDGLALQEIAQALAVPLGTVKSRLHAALDQLRQNPAILRTLSQAR